LPIGPLPSFTDAVAPGKVNCATPNAELFSQNVAVASQNRTIPAVIGEPPDVTVAVKMIGV
jgi:hypothetical protein